MQKESQLAAVRLRRIGHGASAVPICNKLGAPLDSPNHFTTRANRIRSVLLISYYISAL